jgi:hypothetical protein
VGVVFPRPSTARFRWLELNLRFLLSSLFEREQPLVTGFAERLRGIELRHQWPIHGLFHSQQSLIAGFRFQLHTWTALAVIAVPVQLRRRSGSNSCTCERMFVPPVPRENRMPFSSGPAAVTFSMGFCHFGQEGASIKHSSRVHGLYLRRDLGIEVLYDSKQ